MPKNIVLVARIKKGMHRGRPPILREFPSSFAIKIMASGHVLLIMRINKDKDENKHGRHYVWKA